MIGHMKTDGLLARNWLKGSIADATHAVLCGAIHNLRMLLVHRRVLYCALVGQLVLLIRLIASGQPPYRPTYTSA